ncbi:hypothetical protein [Nocardioides sp. Root190]|uniref:hypothetical protein n=1 Tax=Nocardioides sp. Root190 TaxID=1736488 RepID=UPI0012FC157F|nr:hypothetical protein [Nocardioides sp. Root190]
MVSPTEPRPDDTCPECGSAMDHVELPGGDEPGRPARLVCPRCNHEEHGDRR